MFSLFKKKPKASPEPAPLPIFVPRIKKSDYIEALQRSVIEPIPADQLPIVEALVGDLALAYGIDVGHSYEMVSLRDLERYSIDRPQLRAIAERNAIELLKGLRVEDEVGGALHKLYCEELNMAACSILFPALWRQIEEELASPLLVAFPESNLVLYAKNDVEGRQVLADAISAFDFNDKHMLSRRIYEFTGQGWTEAAP